MELRRRQNTASYFPDHNKESDKESDKESNKESDDKQLHNEEESFKIKNSNKTSSKGKNRKYGNQPILRIGSKKRIKQNDARPDIKHSKPITIINKTKTDIITPLTVIPLMPGEIFEPVPLEDEALPFFFNLNYPESNNKMFTCKLCRLDSRKKINYYSYSRGQGLLTHYSSHHNDMTISDLDIKCDACGIYFYHEYYLDMHKSSEMCKEYKPKLIDNSLYDYEMSKCSYCEIIFLSRSRYRSHLNKINDGCRYQNGEHPREMGLFDYMKCKYCEKTFLDRRAFTEHVTPYSCTIDPVHKQYEVDVVGKEHFKCKNVSKIIWQCVICHAHYMCYKRFTLHMEHDHEIEDMGCKCGKCGNQFWSNSTLAKHIEGNKYFTKCVDMEQCMTVPFLHEDAISCPVCGKVFTKRAKTHYNWYGYKKHLVLGCAKNSFFKDNWKCNKCNKVFYTQTEYNDHITEWKCPFCSRLFAKRALFRKHVRMVHRDQNLAAVVCDFDGCDQRFFNHYEASMHYNVSHKKTKKNMQCPCCDIATASKARMVLHLNTHQDEKVRGTNHKCKMCKKEFITGTGLFHHKNTVHNKEHPGFKCDNCGKKFAQLATMKRHQRIHLDKKPFECEICHLFFTQSTGMKSHRNRHYNEDGSLKSPEEIESQVQIILKQRKGEPKKKESTKKPRKKTKRGKESTD